MSSSLHYFATSTQSNLYIRLQEDFAYRAILLSLMPYSSELYQFFEIDPKADVEKVKETIDDILKKRYLLLGRMPRLEIASFFKDIASGRIFKTGSRISAEEVREIVEDIFEGGPSLLGKTPKLKVASFFKDLASARTLSPGIEQRTAMLEKCDHRIRSHLERALMTDYLNTAKLVHRIIIGDKIIGLDPSKEQLQDFAMGGVIGIILPSTVQKGAEILAQIEPIYLFPQDNDSDDWNRDNYERWRRTYLAAADHGEALLVGRS